MKNSLKDIINFYLKLWPGLIHLGHKPIIHQPVQKTKKIRIYLPSTGILHLRSVAIIGPTPTALDKASYTMSSFHKSSSDPKDLIKGKWIHTNLENQPYWEIEFKNPEPVVSIEIYNRLGQWSHRAYGLRIDLEGEFNSDCFDNLDLDRITQKQIQLSASLLQALNNIYKTDISDAIKELCISISSIIKKTISNHPIINTPLADIFASEFRQNISRKLNELCLAITEERPSNKNNSATKFLIDVQPFMESLMSRDPKNENLTHDDLKLTAFSLTGVILKNGRATLDIVEDYSMHLNNATNLLYIEELINKTLSNLNLSQIELPVIFRAHGLSSSSLHSDPQSYIKSMKEVSNILSENGYKSGICYGTLLGAIRENGFIPHDDDVDMFVLLQNIKGPDFKDELVEISRILNQFGVISDFCDGHDFLKAKSSIGGRYVDIFPISIDQEGLAWMFMEQLKVRPINSDFIHPLTSVNLLGEEFLSFSRNELFLRERYGDDWNTPIRFVGSKRIPVE